MPELTEVCGAGLAGPPIQESQIADAAVDALHAEARSRRSPAWSTAEGAQAIPIPPWRCSTPRPKRCESRCGSAPKPRGRYRSDAELRALLGEIGRAAERRVLESPEVSAPTAAHCGRSGCLPRAPPSPTGAESAASFAALVARIPDVGA